MPQLRAAAAAAIPPEAATAGAGNPGAATAATILAVDVGAVATKVGLIERVVGEYRVVGATRALSTADLPEQDVMVGVRQAIMQLQVLTGRRLLDSQTPYSGELIQPTRMDGAGCDACVAVTSAALPLRTVVIGLSRDYSVTGARRAVNSTFAIVDHTIAVDQESGRWGTTAQDGRAGGPSASVEKLATLQPDLVVMVGGTDGGAITPLREMANIVAAVAAALDPTRRPLVIFAGNRRARDQVAERLGALVDLRMVENVLPTLGRFNPLPLQAEIEAVYRERQLSSIPGLDRLAAWSRQGIMTSADAFTRVAEYLARKYQLRVLALDLGAASTTILRADTSGSRRALVQQVNLGFGLPTLLDHVGLERILHWLPIPFDPADVHAALLNQAIRPSTTPTRSQDLAALNAAGRQVIAYSARAWEADVQPIDPLPMPTLAPQAGLPGHLAFASNSLAARLDDSTTTPLSASLSSPLSDDNADLFSGIGAPHLGDGSSSHRGAFHRTPPFIDSELILLTGAPLARGNKPNSLLLMLLDALDIRGIFSVAADQLGLLPALGAVAAVNPEAAAGALENDCLVTWGTVFVPTLNSGPAAPSLDSVLDVTVEPARGGRLQADVRVGSLELIPLAEGEKATLQIRAPRGISWGSAFTGNVFHRHVQGGTVGLVIDARGRPLPDAPNAGSTSDKVQQWMWEAGA